jgi:hypothetical protein
MKPSYGLILLILASLLAGCDQLGIDTPAAEAAREEAEGKAIGSACRQTGRALEDCYLNNRRAPKAAIFNGWRDMDAYMRENKIPEIKPESEKSDTPEKGEAKEKADAKPPASPTPEAPKAAATSDTAAAKAPVAKGDDKTPEAKTPAPVRRARPALAR